MTGEPRIRLLAVMASLMGGGAERQMVLTLKHLDRSRFEPTLCLLERQGAFLQDLPADIPVLDLRKRAARDAPLLVVRLARVLREVRPDVVFSKVDYTNVIVALAAALARSSAAVVAGETALQSRALENMSHPAVRRALLRWAYPRAARVVAATPGVVADLSDGLRVKGDYEVIPNMLAVAAAQEAAKRDASHPFADDDVPLAVTAGRLAPGKGQADLLRAFAILADRRRCNLLVLGEGPEQARLEALARELGIADRVAFLGFVQNPHALMARADVFVSPSHAEAFGNAIVEAMAVGTPVVSTRVPAGPEWIIEDRQTGVFAAPRDPDDLAAKIELVLDDPELAAAIASRGRLRAADFEEAEVARRFERLFERLARQPR